MGDKKRNKKDSDFWKEAHNKSMEGLMKSLVDSRDRVERKELKDFWKEIYNKSIEGQINELKEGEE